MSYSQTESVCTVELLSVAAQAVYRVKKDNIIDPSYSENYQQSITDIAEHGYAITEAIVPVGSKGTGKTPLGALCLKPHDTKSPIIISFRGTKTSSDVVSDMRLGITGTVDKKFRDDAFDFYQKVRKEHPDREIILTGHSLGGHLAQYVATKAYNTDPELIKAPLLQVRTFNTAPMQTKHSTVFLRAPQVLSQFVNYRLSPDVVSNAPLQMYQGNTFVFPCNKGFLDAHSMKAMSKSIPKEVMQQRVGSSSKGSTQHHQLIELTNGILYSYQCRVNGQFFSRFRMGAKNLNIMQNDLSSVVVLMNKGDYEKAILKLEGLKTKLSGTTSNQLIEYLIQNTKNVNENKAMNAFDSPMVKSTAKLQLMKLALRQGREQEQKKELNITSLQEGIELQNILAPNKPKFH